MPPPATATTTRMWKGLTRMPTIAPVRKVVACDRGGEMDVAQVASRAYCKGWELCDNLSYRPMGVELWPVYPWLPPLPLPLPAGALLLAGGVPPLPLLPPVVAAEAPLLAHLRLIMPSRLWTRSAPGWFSYAATRHRHR